MAGGLVAVLQRRGAWNFEKMTRESFTGACQITSIGKCEEGEDPWTAAYRELAEELGNEARKVASNDNEIEIGDENTSIWAVKVPIHFLHTIRLHPGSGGLVFLTASQLGNVIELKRKHKEDGVRDANVIAMFPDEIEAVRRAFKELG